MSSRPFRLNQSPELLLTQRFWTYIFDVRKWGSQRHANIFHGHINRISGDIIYFVSTSIVFEFFPIEDMKNPPSLSFDPVFMDDAECAE